MEIIRVAEDNIAKEHICCAIGATEKKYAESKKSWLKDTFKEGYIFKRLSGRGKMFIEYTIAENAWAPIEADGYIFIDCFWVAGKFKSRGVASALLDECIKDSKKLKKKGVTAISSDKKRHFLSDGNFYKHKGFNIADKTEPYYELLYLTFNKEEKYIPSFKKDSKLHKINKEGVSIYYTDHCPFTKKMIPIFEKISKEKKIPFDAVKIKTKKEAQNAPNPFTTYSLFFNGKLVTNEIFSDKKFIKFLDDLK